MIGEHEAEARSHRNHRQFATGAGSPVQLAVAISVSPSRGAPRIAGVLVISGAVACADAKAGSSSKTSAVTAAVKRSGRIVTD